MSKKNCGLIKDLLPLYADGVCSEDSKKAVTDHIAGCDDCRSDLEKMGRDIKLSADKDIAAVKKIKKKLRIRNIIIAAVTAIVVGFGAFCFIQWMDCPVTMSYNGFNMSENVYAEADENGDLWLVRKDIAAESFILMKNDDENFAWNIKDDANIDFTMTETIGVTLYRRRWLNHATYVMKPEYPTKSLLFNINKWPEVNELCYYDEVSGEKIVLWTRTQ